MNFSMTSFRLLAVAAIAFATSSANADLLTNGSFETGDLSGWTLGAPAHSVGAPGVGAQTGSFAGRLNAPADGVPEMRQFAPAVAGNEFNFSGYMLTETALPAVGTGATFGVLKMVFRDGPNFTGNDLQVTSASIGNIVGPANPGVESFQLNGTSPANTWLFGEMQAVAPVGTQSVGFLLLTIDFGNGANHPMWFDNFQASAVPEPTSLIAIGVMGLAVVSRRRRNS